MAVITQTIQPGERRNEVTEGQKGLISLGATIAPEELFTGTTAGTYGPTTQAAIGALIHRFSFLVVDRPIFNAFAGRLLNIAVGAEVGNSAALQKAVRESFDATPAASRSELAWQARYAVIARDFSMARRIVEMIPDGSGPHDLEERDTIASIVRLSTLQPPAPELLNQRWPRLLRQRSRHG